MNEKKDVVGIDSSTLLEKFARWIVNHPPEFGGDHACSECYPNSEILKDGFVCAYHEAKLLIDNSNVRCDSTPDIDAG